TRFDALKHPNWTMGAKITIDSATLVNKGLEIIEAKHLFGLDVDNITPVVHRESIIHSMVEFTDGSVIGQMGVPDMRLPIAYALTYPLRKIPVSEPLDLVKVGQLTFFDIDSETFPAVELAKKAAKIGGTMPAVLNGANEEAVAAFLRDGCGFLEITELIEKAMDKHSVIANPNLGDIVNADKEAREFVRESLNK
ncbi:MAG: 1-deoxy-D-xylulose-5-phosphate reductoisomerase, partial [Clostridia bacterium]